MSLIDSIDEHGLTESKLAHKYRNSTLTYKELAEKSNAIAAYLIERFGEDKTPIVVYGHKQQEMLICFLACVKSGHAYIPIDSSLPIERVKDIINSAEAKLMFSVSELATEMSNIDSLDLSQIKEICEVNKMKKPSLQYRVKEDETYYIIYTSGSTGKPKGVQITLGCLESFVKWGLEVSKLKKEEKHIFMNQAPFSFDLSVMDLYLSLASGSILYSIDKGMISNLKELFAQLKESGITVWVSTPSFAEMCLADTSFNQNLLPDLKQMLFCGETLTNSTAKRLNDRFDNVSVTNTYGPTEATVAITSVDICKELYEKEEPLPVGIVKKDCKILIVNENGVQVPPGEKGEIVIVGESVSIGYYKNEEMTQKSFYKIEIDGKEKRAYKTGDEGFLRNEMLYYCGRIDFQVKLNGFRIELEDIESNLRKVNCIKNAVVLPVHKENKIQYLAAFVTLNEVIEEKEFKIALRIKTELKNFLPEYMIPRKIVIKETLPMTVNGKINRKALMEEI